MNDTPLVSIVIPVYNGANYLREAIDSALAQTHDNIEVIVVNDGSNDNGATERIALSYGDRIRYVAKENGGVASALNMGIKKMEGEYFAWLSHDDVWPAHKLERQIEILMGLSDKHIVLFSNYYITDGDLHIQYTVNMDHQLANEKPLYTVFRGMLNGCTMLIPKKCFDVVGLFADLRHTQDYDMWFRLVRKFSFYHIEEALLYSRLHEAQGSLSGDAVKESDQLWIRLMSSLTEYEVLGLESSYAKFFQGMCTFFADKPYARAGEYAYNQYLKYSGGTADSYKSLLRKNMMMLRVTLRKNHLIYSCYIALKKCYLNLIGKSNPLVATTSSSTANSILAEFHFTSSIRSCDSNDSDYPLVSVIIPTHNRAYCLPIAVASVMAQSWSNIEVIIVDDASTDWTSQLCDHFSNRYGKCVKIVKNFKQSGASASRNAGIEVASGEYIAFLDSDDFFHADKIRLQIEALQQDSNAVLCTCWFSWLYKHDNKLVPLEFEARDVSYPNCLSPASILVTPSVIVPKLIFDQSGMFDESLDLCEDIDLWTKVLRFGKPLVICKNLVTAVVHDGRTADYLKFCRARDMLYQKAFNRDSTLPDEFKKRLYVELLREYIICVEDNPALYMSFRRLLSESHRPFTQWYGLFCKENLNAKRKI